MENIQGRKTQKAGLDRDNFSINSHRDVLYISPNLQDILDCFVSYKI